MRVDSEGVKKVAQVHAHDQWMWLAKRPWLSLCSSAALPVPYLLYNRAYAATTLRSTTSADALTRLESSNMGGDPLHIHHSHSRTKIRSVSLLLRTTNRPLWRHIFTKAYGQACVCISIVTMVLLRPGRRLLKLVERV
jgi:starvation-inducible outer membrane lipoprotein